MAVKGRTRSRSKRTGKKIRVQVILDEDIVEKVDHYAAQYNQSRSYFCACAIEDNVTEGAAIHNLANSMMMRPIAKICNLLYGEQNEKKRKEYMELLDQMTRKNIDEL